MKQYSNLSIDLVESISYVKGKTNEKIKSIIKNNRISKFNIIYIPNINSEYFTIEKIKYIKCNNININIINEKRNNIINPYVNDNIKHSSLNIINKENLKSKPNQNIAYNQSSGNSLIFNNNKLTTKGGKLNSFGTSTNNVENIDNINLDKDSNLLSSIKKIYNNNIVKTIDERGFITDEFGGYYDNNQDYYNDEDKKDIYDGQYNKFGQYIESGDFNKDILMYNKEIESIGKNIDEIKKIAEEAKSTELEKIKYESLKYKNLNQDPTSIITIKSDDDIEKSDDCSDEFLNNININDNLLELFSDPNEADQSKDKLIIPNNKNSFLFSSASNSDIIYTTFCSNNNNINNSQNLPKKENVDISNSKNIIFNKTNLIKIELIKKEPNKLDENVHNKNISDNKSNNKEYNLDQKKKIIIKLK